MTGWGQQGYGMGWFGGIFMILFWVAIIVGAVLLIRYFTAGGGSPVSPGSRGEDPLQILKGRYARGEIDTQEFEERRKMLEGKPLRRNDPGKACGGVCCPLGWDLVASF